MSLLTNGGNSKESSKKPRIFIDLVFISSGIFIPALLKTRLTSEPTSLFEWPTKWLAFASGYIQSLPAGHALSLVFASAVASFSLALSAVSSKFPTLSHMLKIKESNYLPGQQPFPPCNRARVCHQGSRWTMKSEVRARKGAHSLSDWKSTQAKPTNG